LQTQGMTCANQFSVFEAIGRRKETLRAGIVAAWAAYFWGAMDGFCAEGLSSRHCGQ
jgi:hypothetical protein